MHASAGGGGIGGALATAAAEPQLPANQQTALRLAANAFQHPVLRQWITAQVLLGPELRCLTFVSALTTMTLHTDCPSRSVSRPSNSRRESCRRQGCWTALQHACNPVGRRCGWVLQRSC
jgi:hypothetical protein